MYAETAVHLNPFSVPLCCPAVITEQVVCRRFRAAEEICAQVVTSAASPVKSGFMGMENSILVWASAARDSEWTGREQGRGDGTVAQDLGGLKEGWRERDSMEMGFFLLEQETFIFIMYAWVILENRNIDLL